MTKSRGVEDIGLIKTAVGARVQKTSKKFGIIWLMRLKIFILNNY
jgi:hypothetical protein